VGTIEQAVSIAISLRSQAIDARWRSEPSPSLCVTPVIVNSAMVLVPKDQLERAEEVLRALGIVGADIDWSQVGRMVVSDDCCARCGYSFDGLNQPERCPECGRANMLDDAMGERHRMQSRPRRIRRFRRGLAFMLVLLLALGIVLIVSTAL
jgi:predicted Zn-ribbon and HTH transcriptional regulator